MKLSLSRPLEVSVMSLGGKSMSWNKLDFHKITVRLTVKYTLFFTLSLLIISGIVLFSISYYINNQSSNQILNISQAVNDRLQMNQDITLQDLDEISQMNENIDLLVYDDKNLLFSTGEDYQSKIPEEKTIKPQNMEMGESKLIYFTSVYQVKSDTDMTEQSVKEITIQVIKDMDNEREFIRVLFWILLLLNFIAFLVSILLGFIMSRKALEPIEEITEQAKLISISDLSMRINIEGPDDELTRLADTFNKMIASIEYGYEKQNRFALDASHELATPLAVIKGYIDLIGRWGKNDPNIMDEGITAIKDEISNMTKLLDTLLFLAKNDHENMRLEKNKFWINDLIIETIRDNKLIYPDAMFSYTIKNAVEIKADRRVIKQMFRAIIDNGLKYSKDTVEISMTGELKKDVYEIVISDKGIGIGEDDIEHIFDRFYRVDKSRTRENGGSGLGLSIVKGIIDNHKGSISIKSQLDKGSDIIIHLPVAK